jgi:phospholipid transport system substrate-binding protein
LWNLSRTNRTLLACLLLPFCLQVLAEPATPVSEFHEGLIEVMKSENYDDRVKLLTPIVERNFDTATVARIALGRNWRKMKQANKSIIMALMSQVIVSSYASRFPTYTRQYFEIVGQKPVKSNRIIVRTRLHTDAEIVDLDYQLVDLDGHWKIFDVVANGVSDLSLKRSTYSATFKTGGIAAVIEEIRQTIKDNQDKAILL